MPTKDIKKITLSSTGQGRYRINDMDGMAQITVDGETLRVGDGLSHEQLLWLEGNWVCDETDDNRNSMKYSMKVKKG